MARVTFLSGDLYLAICLQTQAVLNSSHLSSELASSVYTLALYLYISNGNLRPSLELLRHSLDIYRITSHPLDQAQAWQTTGALLLIEGFASEAVEALETSERLLKDF